MSWKDTDNLRVLEEYSKRIQLAKNDPKAFKDLFEEALDTERYQEWAEEERKRRQELGVMTNGQRMCWQRDLANSMENVPEWIKPLRKK